MYCSSQSVAIVPSAGSRLLKYIDQFRTLLQTTAIESKLISLKQSRRKLKGRNLATGWNSSKTKDDHPKIRKAWTILSIINRPISMGKLVLIGTFRTKDLPQDLKAPVRWHGKWQMRREISTNETRDLIKERKNIHNRSQRRNKWWSHKSLSANKTKRWIFHLILFLKHGRLFRRVMIPKWKSLRCLSDRLSLNQKK